MPLRSLWFRWQPLAGSGFVSSIGVPSWMSYLMTPRKWLLPIREPPHARADEDAPADPTAPTAIAAPATRNTNNFLIRKVPPPSDYRPAEYLSRHLAGASRFIPLTQHSHLSLCRSESGSLAGPDRKLGRWTSQGSSVPPPWT